jgi:hypothetical protein
MRHTIGVKSLATAHGGNKKEDGQDRFSFERNKGLSAAILKDCSIVDGSVVVLVDGDEVVPLVKHRRLADPLRDGTINVDQAISASSTVASRRCFIGGGLAIFSHEGQNPQHGGGCGEDD